MSDELKPCPFCNAVLAEDKAGTRYFTHPKADCILSQIEFDMDGAPEMVEQWNRRAQPAEEVQKGALRKDAREALKAAEALIARIEYFYDGADMFGWASVLKKVRAALATKDQP